MAPGAILELLVTNRIQVFLFQAGYKSLFQRSAYVRERRVAAWTYLQDAKRTEVSSVKGEYVTLLLYLSKILCFSLSRKSLGYTMFYTRQILCLYTLDTMYRVDILLIVVDILDICGWYTLDVVDILFLKFLENSV